MGSQEKCPGEKPRPPRWFAREVEGGRLSARPLRLIILHWDRHPTAREVYREHFIARGHQVDWIEEREGTTIAFGHEDLGRLQVFPFYFPRLLRSGSSPWRAFDNRRLKLLGFIRKWLFVFDRTRRTRPDWVQARDNTTEAFIAWSVARLTQTRFAYQLDYWHPEAALYSASLKGRVPVVRRWRSRWHIFLRDRLLRASDLAFLISDAMRDHYRGIGLEATRLHVFPVGATAEFHRRLATKQEARRSLGLGDNPTIAYVGSLDPLRRPDQLFRVLQGVVSRVEEARILLFTREVDAAHDLVRSYNLTDHVAAIESIPHHRIPEVLPAADIGLFPLAEDDPYGIIHVASPLKVVEYMACGVVPVSSRNPEVEELVTLSGVGSVCEDEPAAFVEACVSLCHRHEDLAELGRRGREYVLRYKSCAALAEIIERAYAGHLGESDS